jgi:hypothetical protein
MGNRMRDLLDGALGSLRYEACEKRLRLSLDGELVAETFNGLLVREPRRLVPTYAVPHADFAAQLESARQVDELADLPVLVPTNPFAVHTCTGEILDVVLGDRRCPSAAFRPDDPDLAGYLTLDFSGPPRTHRQCNSVRRCAAPRRRHLSTLNIESPSSGVPSV